MGDLIGKFESKVNVQGTTQGTASQKFTQMAIRLKEWIKDIRNNEAKLEFSAAGLQTVGGSNNNALSEQWLSAFQLIDQRAQEKNNGIQESAITEMNEYYVFTKCVLSKMSPDWENPVLKFNSLPICVDAKTKIIKVHMLFQMLGIGGVYIAERGKFKGKLTLEKFLNLRYTEQTYM